MSLPTDSLYTTTTQMALISAVTLPASRVNLYPSPARAQLIWPSSSEATLAHNPPIARLQYLQTPKHFVMKPQPHGTEQPAED